MHVNYRVPLKYLAAFVDHEEGGRFGHVHIPAPPRAEWTLRTKLDVTVWNLKCHEICSAWFQRGCLLQTLSFSSRCVFNRHLSFCLLTCPLVHLVHLVFPSIIWVYTSSSHLALMNICDLPACLMDVLEFLTMKILFFENCRWSLRWRMSDRRMCL